MIEIKNLQKVYENGFMAIDNLSFALPDKGLVCIVGESGSGKTTLLNCIFGVESYQGEICIDGELITKFNSEVVRRTKMSMIYQDYQLLEDLTVYDNIVMAMECVGQKASKEQILQFLSYVGLQDDIVHKKCKNLSGGEKQRVAIARAISQNSKIILADEPTGNLDEENAENIFELLKKVSKNALVVVVTHNEDLAKQYSDFVCAMQDGELQSDLQPAMQEKNECKTTLKNKNKTKLSGKSFVNIFKMIFSNKVFACLLSVFSVVLMLSTMVMFGLFDVTENSIVMNNTLQKPEHTMCVNLKKQKHITSDFDNQNACFEYHTLDINLMSGGEFHTDKNEELLFYSVRPSWQFVVECQDISKIGGKLRYGTNPSKPNELAINEYTAKWIVNNKVSYGDLQIKKESDLLGLQVDGFTIVGIIDAKIEDKKQLFALEQEEYFTKDLRELDEDEREIVKNCLDMITINFDSQLMTVGEGFAQANKIANSTGVYLSSKTPNLKKYIFSLEEKYPENVLISSYYTYQNYRITRFFNDNRYIFKIASIALGVLSGILTIVSCYLLLSNNANNILILRMLGINKSKLIIPLGVGLMLLILLQVGLAVAGCFAVNAILNASIAKKVVLGLNAVFYSFAKSAIFVGATFGASLIVFAIYVLAKFAKPINILNRKEKH